MEQVVKTSGRGCLQDAQRSPAKALGPARLSRDQGSVKMGFYARFPGAERASLFGLGSAHGAADGQYLSQREFPGFHNNIIQHR